jgi:hypothetical protein
MTALSVAKSAAPATLKIAVTWVPERAPTTRNTVAPRVSPKASWIVKATEIGPSPGLRTPTFVRNPMPGPPLRIEVRTVRAYASERERPGTNMPTVGTGEVE